MIEALLLYNPVAGRSPLTLQRLKNLREKLDRSGIRTQAFASYPERKSAPSFHLENKELLLVYGGDGTIHDAIQEAVKWKIPVGLLPGGTVNGLARELEIPQNLDQAIEVVARKKLHKIYLGKANGEFFHMMAGIGLDGYVINQLDLRLKKALGVSSYWIAGLTFFWKYPLKEFELTLDGENHRATFAVIGNGRLYGGQLLITPKASVNEDMLDVCMFTSKNRLRFFKYLGGAFNGRHVNYPDVFYRKSQEVRVSGDKTILVQMDGEVVGRIPMTFSTYREGIEIIVP